MLMAIYSTTTRLAVPKAALAYGIANDLEYFYYYKTFIYTVINQLLWSLNVAIGYWVMDDVNE